MLGKTTYRKVKAGVGLDSPPCFPLAFPSTNHIRFGGSIRCALLIMRACDMKRAEWRGAATTPQSDHPSSCHFPHSPTPPPTPADDTNQPNRFRCAAWLNFSLLLLLLLLRKVYIERVSTRIGACV